MTIFNPKEPKTKADQFRLVLAFLNIPGTGEEESVQTEDFTLRMVEWDMEGTEDNPYPPRFHPTIAVSRNGIEQSFRLPTSYLFTRPDASDRDEAARTQALILLSTTKSRIAQLEADQKAPKPHWRDLLIAAQETVKQREDEAEERRKQMRVDVAASYGKATIELLTKVFGMDVPVFHRETGAVQVDGFWLKIDAIDDKDRVQTDMRNRLHAVFYVWKDAPEGWDTGNWHSKHEARGLTEYISEWVDPLNPDSLTDIRYSLAESLDRINREYARLVEQLEARKKGQETAATPEPQEPSNTRILKWDLNDERDLMNAEISMERHRNEGWKSAFEGITANSEGNLFYTVRLVKISRIRGMGDGAIVPLPGDDSAIGHLTAPAETQPE